MIMFAIGNAGRWKYRRKWCLTVSRKETNALSETIPEKPPQRAAPSSAVEAPKDTSAAVSAQGTRAGADCNCESIGLRGNRRSCLVDRKLDNRHCSFAGRSLDESLRLAKEVAE